MKVFARKESDVIIAERRFQHHTEKVGRAGSHYFLQVKNYAGWEARTYISKARAFQIANTRLLV